MQTCSAFYICKSSCDVFPSYLAAFLHRSERRWASLRLWHFTSCVWCSEVLCSFTADIRGSLLLVYCVSVFSSPCCSGVTRLDGVFSFWLLLFQVKFISDICLKHLLQCFFFIFLCDEPTNKLKSSSMGISSVKSCLLVFWNVASSPEWRAQDDQQLVVLIVPRCGSGFVIRAHSFLYSDKAYK